MKPVGRAWVFGVDIGQAQDHPAIVGNHVILGENPQEKPIHQIRYIERIPLGTEYSAIVERVGLVLNAPGVVGATRKVVVDGTGQGRPLVEQFRKRVGARVVVPVNITHGEVVSWGTGGWWNVPKAHLVSILRLTLAERRLRIAKGLEWSDELKMEMLDFRVKLRASETSFEADAGAHDDLVMALATALWFAEDQQWFLRPRHRTDPKPLPVANPKHSLSMRNAFRRG